MSSRIYPKTKNPENLARLAGVESKDSLIYHTQIFIHKMSMLEVPDFRDRCDEYDKFLDKLEEEYPMAYKYHRFMMNGFGGIRDNPYINEEYGSESDPEKVKQILREQYDSISEERLEEICKLCEGIEWN